MKRLIEATQLVQEKNYQQAAKLVNDVLDDDPNNGHALYILGFIAYEEDRLGVARNLLKRCMDLGNVNAKILALYGRTFQEGHDLAEAEAVFKKAIALDPKYVDPYLNIGLNYVVQGKPEKAFPWLEKALSLSPGLPEALFNRGIAKLMNGDWTGWEDYEAFVGRSPDRKERVYGNEPRWNGEKGKTIVTYGEQGIGDEIKFSSCIPDLIKDSKKVIIECDRRLKGLFKRSFPEADVYGTRFVTDSPELNWIQNYQIDGRAAFSSLPKYYRKKTEDFPGKPFLVADPERRLQWKTLLASISDKKKVGIAWTGGTKATGSNRRRLTLEELLPILSQDFTFVSLEYRNRDEEIEEFHKKHGIKIHHWQRALDTYDYDDTAGLVAELDMVIGVNTSALHLSSSLGVKTLAMIPEWPIWVWGCKGDSVPWSKDLKIFRQKGSWESVISRVANEIKGK